ncbi:MAG TPA: DUF1427 family protein [Pseudolabrys sp.]|nr:DUF1427 family protein [Pseudolabrys sp.]
MIGCTTRASTKVRHSRRQSAVLSVSKACCRRPCFRLSCRSLLQVRSPAPPLMALVSLLGITLGGQAIAMVKHHLTPPLHTSICGSRRPAMCRSATPTRAMGCSICCATTWARQRT